MQLPATATAAASRQPAQWLVAARNGVDVSRIARRFNARELRLDNVYVLARRDARAFAAALRVRGTLRYAEPDVLRRRAAAFDGLTDRWARAAVVSPATPPPAKPQGIGVIDDLVDAGHPDLAGSVFTRNDSDPMVHGPHGTMVASAAAGAANGAGVTGVLPGAPVYSFPVPPAITCEDSANGITALAEADVKVINASYGCRAECFTEYAAVSVAYARGAVVVAASASIHRLISVGRVSGRVRWS